MADEDEGPGEDEEDDREFEIVKGHVAALMEHFDAVQIFTTKQISRDTTRNSEYGGGNWFTRLGQVGEWYERQKGEAREKGAANAREPDGA